MKPETKQVAAMLKITAAIGEAIQEAKEIPSGHLYAIVMSQLSLEQYQSAIRTLKETGLVQDDNHLLRWIGPEKQTPTLLKVMPI